MMLTRSLLRRANCHVAYRPAVGVRPFHGSTRRLLDQAAAPVSDSAPADPAPPLPRLEDILPSKNTMKKYLFERQSPLNYQEVLRSYRACMKMEFVADIPANVTGDDLMTLKQILERHRKDTGSFSTHLAQLENNLVEVSAERGNNTAIVLLCSRILTNTIDKNDTIVYSQEDKDHAQDLLKQLCEAGFPLAFKIKGDLAYKMGHVDEASKSYQACIDAGPAEDNMTTECYRSIGIIAMMNFDLNRAKNAFENAITLGSRQQVRDCYYYLGQLYEDDKLRSKYYLEIAAGQGLKEAFTPLGFLQLNYFNNIMLAEDWFKVGYEINDFNSCVGLFDVYIRGYKTGKTKDELLLDKALKISDKISDSKETEAVEQFKESRKESLDILREYKTKIDQKLKAQLPANETDRWNFS